MRVKVTRSDRYYYQLDNSEIELLYSKLNELIKVPNELLKNNMDKSISK